MAYTDENPQGVKIKKVHLDELKTSIDTLATNKKVTISVASLAYDKVNAANIQNIQSAIHTLESAFSGNCCQANCCQTCQTAGCQTTGCQTQTCQSQCKGCQSQCNCDCTC